MANSANNAMPPFQEAVEDFRAFLATQGVNSKLLWIFREDVVWHQYRVFIRQPLPSNNERAVEVLYKRGVRRGLGISRGVLCLLKLRPCCYIRLPADEEDAEYAMLSGLKLSVPVNPLEARSVRGRLQWLTRTWRDQKEAHQIFTELPSRRDAMRALRASLARA